MYLPWQELRFVMNEISVEDTVRPDDWSISRGNLHDCDSSAQYPTQDTHIMYQYFLDYIQTQHFKVL